MTTYLANVFSSSFSDAPKYDVLQDALVKGLLRLSFSFTNRLVSLWGMQLLAKRI